MKFLTSIIEIVGYLAIVLGISALFQSFIHIDTPNFPMLIGMGIVLILVGILLNKLEISIEKKRIKPTKHIDHIILRVIGWFILVISVVSLLAPNLFTQSILDFSQIVWSIFLIVEGKRRKELYKTYNTSPIENTQTIEEDQQHKV